MDYVEIRDNEHCTYILCAEVNGSLCAKIGMSSFIGQRVQQIAHGIPFDLSTGWLLKAPSRFKAAEVEKGLLKRLAEFRSRGEWIMLADPEAGLRLLETAVDLACMKHSLDLLRIDVQAFLSVYRAEVAATRMKAKPRNKTILEKRMDALWAKRDAEIASGARSRAENRARINAWTDRLIRAAGLPVPVRNSY